MGKKIKTWSLTNLVVMTLSATRFSERGRYDPGLVIHSAPGRYYPSSRCLFRNDFTLWAPPITLKFYSFRIQNTHFSKI